jgi:hypothetical protein
MFYKIVDILPVEKKQLIFFDQNDDDILESGGINKNTMRSIESDLWESWMCHISEYMSICTIILNMYNT